MNCIMGIDPGLGGGIALYDVNKKRLVFLGDMPCKLSKSDKRMVDSEGVANIIRGLKHLTRFAVVEEVASSPQQGIVSAFNFGRSFGILVGALAAHDIKTHFVKSQIWKSIFNLPREKEASLEKALEFFPGQSEYFKRAKDDGRAEAALIAKFGERFL